jgi:hypothetical protein
MTPHELVAKLTTLGVSLEVRGGRLRASPKSRITTSLDEALKVQAKALIALLNAARSNDDDGCPVHWLHIPVMPPKGRSVITQSEDGQGLGYRVKLFEQWYIVRFCPHISESHVEVVCTTPKRRMFADLHEFYRWAWAENFYANLTYKSLN